jgi:hypothetical protein
LVNITPSPKAVKDVKYYGWAVYEDVELDEADDVILGEFLDTVNLNQVFIVKNSDGSEVTASILLNVATVTTVGLTDAECTVFAYGRRV